jgi:4-hydroxy-3-methylbut-2-enyl diphosphate reductase
MQVILAEAMGMCFGVSDALAVMRAVERPVEVTVMGELVHNPVVGRQIVGRGFSVLGEAAAAGGMAPVTGAVLITAHGISDTERAKLAAAGKRIVDTTCPLVRRAHRTALKLAGEGHFVVVVGKRGHVEVRGLVGDLQAGAFAVVVGAEEVRAYGWEKIGVMAQTTAVESEVAAVTARVRETNARAEVRMVNTVCAPTRDRQAALERLVEQVDVLVVVGGRGSNNTRRLAETGARLGAGRGVRVMQVEDAGELAEEAFGGEERVGVTAGTSVLAETVEAVVEKLRGFHAVCVGR